MVIKLVVFGPQLQISEPNLFGFSHEDVINLVTHDRIMRSAWHPSPFLICINYGTMQKCNLPFSWKQHDGCIMANRHRCEVAFCKSHAGWWWGLTEFLNQESQYRKEDKHWEHRHRRHQCLQLCKTRFWKAKLVKLHPDFQISLKGLFLKLMID